MLGWWINLGLNLMLFQKLRLFVNIAGSLYKDFASIHITNKTLKLF